MRETRRAEQEDILNHDSAGLTLSIFSLVTKNRTKFKHYLKLYGAFMAMTEVALALQGVQKAMFARFSYTLPVSIICMIMSSTNAFNLLHATSIWLRSRVKELCVLNKEKRPCTKLVVLSF